MSKKVGGGQKCKEPVSQTYNHHGTVVCCVAMACANALHCFTTWWGKESFSKSMAQAFNELSLNGNADAGETMVVQKKVLDIEAPAVMSYCQF